MSTGEDVATRLARIRERVAEAALRVGRRPEEVRILGAAKGQSPEKIREAAAAGLTLVGENYVQEAERKKRELTDLPLSWHLIGPLQKNKARKALGLFDLIETVDRPEIARRLSNLAREAGRVLPVLIQVNIGREKNKAGVLPEDLEDLIRFVVELPNLHLKGLMALPPYREDPEEVRPYFRKLRELRDIIKEKLGLSDLTELSMGMSHDFEVAVEEGATIVRIGTALFGPRTSRKGV
ncbi:YggS family pyridoxal phosphate-dependent enzyme [Thermosulfurimonas sp. F29]|uniref:YggS family pyridoxal phosphate-dependent enzyme n=1 Tax=Thermosulfurimonas sp. F29 TaxID=2867247 RepID=UPI001C82FBF4|nr:YggS family pyridoxal phosphate-dependent enzyme [Thermosulfurimonas sp. F29]MBX6423157.1 YggS family pyridoxal phosphate-dependent enzyme [Thermosulfurimonas sp. F29]